MTNDANDTTGLQLFDFTASAVGTFPKSFRGYDRRIVDAYVYDLEHKAIQAKREAREAGNKAFRLELLLDSGDFSKLGAHTASILTAAEQQCTELVATANAEAEQIVSEALSAAQTIRLQAEEEAQEIRLTGLNAIAGLRAQAEAEAADRLTSASEQSAARIQTAADQAQQTKEEAQITADQAVSAAQTKAKQLIAAAEAEAAQILAQANAEKEQILSQSAAEQERVRVEVAELLAQNRKSADAYANRVAEQTEQLAKLRSSAEHRADDIRVDALAAADNIKAAARHQAAITKDKADAYVFEQKAQLKREIEQLTARKDAISAQLANLSSLANLSVSELNQMATEVSRALSSNPEPDQGPEETTVLRPGETAPAGLGTEPRSENG